ncbi:MAG: hypothetical protein WBN92_14615 [Terriglobia bacterium]
MAVRKRIEKLNPSRMHDVEGLTAGRTPKGRSKCNSTSAPRRLHPNSSPVMDLTPSPAWRYLFPLDCFVKVASPSPMENSMPDLPDVTWLGPNERGDALRFKLLGV